ncbi:MAG: DNA-formamidopyrimidine glycosylase family protein [Bradymonadia bacterium]
MPEFAEVNIHVRWLQSRLDGFTINRFESSGWNNFKELPDSDRATVPADFFEGNTIKSVTQRGKQIIFHTTNGIVLSHLMFKGRWSLADDPFTSHYHHHSSRPTSNSRTVILHGPSGTLGFHTPEYKAHLNIFPGEHDASAINNLSKLGPDVITTDESDDGFADPWSLEYFQNKAGRSKQAIKPFLLDQKKQAGLGNMYVCESLYDAGIDPSRPANSLSTDEVNRLHEAAQAIVQKAIDLELDYDEILRVYKRSSDPDGHTVRKTTIGGRDTYWVPDVQS